ncbi:MAG: hypothetical protein J6U68_05085 [Clostridia bacterium]|nr:hypothetical protein [Clostridia bacterium]
MRKEEKIEAKGRELFAAVNSGRGFVSFYDEIFGNEKILRRYLIKGGPGTGKSTLMRRIAEEAERQGMQVERYRCSSDPSSLDGVIINGRVAVIDSTAPHTVDAELAGVRDTLVDLGAFWNSEGLYREREEIKALSEDKKRSYALAYRFLSSAMQSDLASRELVAPYINKKRAVRLAKRLTKGIVGDGGYACKIGIINAIGMKGRCSLDTYLSLAERTVYIEEHYGIGDLVLREICNEAQNKGCRIAVSYEPLCPDFINSVFFEESRVLFVLAKERTKGAVSLRRMLDLSALSKRERNALRAKSRYAKRIAEALVTAATDELKTAGDAHFKLEEIYRSYMDFTALDSYSAGLVEKILDFAE